MDGVGFVLTTDVADVEPVQPFPSVTVTVKVPAAFTDLVCVVSPVDQLYDEYDPASKVVELPEQNVRFPVMDGVGFVLTTDVAEVEPVQPFPSVTVTVKVPAVFTVIVCVVAPVLQL